MDQLRVLLIAAQGAPRDSYVKELAELPVTTDAVDAVDQIEATLIDTPFNGILIDVPTLIRATAEQKRKTQILLDYYPVLRLTHRAHLPVSQGLTDGQTHSRTATIADFVGNDAKSFKARPLRSCQRCPITLNVLLLPSPDAPRESGEKAYTVNVSETGCFIASPEPPECDKTIYAVFTDFTDQTPMEIQVCWRSPWGEAKRVPGFGARFTALRPDRNVDLQILLKDTRWLSAT